uniref:C3H1-type domain-containing protein n=1 Tax=Kalanchoe fedtschenkoi TaxID=63787 RepID=A0A7N0TTX5_KALFE
MDEWMFVEPSIRPKMHNKYKHQEGAVTDYPDRPGEPNCIYFLRTGSCGYGTNCRYNHPTHVAQDVVYGLGGELPERDGEPDCGFFMKTGTCKYGSSCKYNHPRDRNDGSPVSFNILGLPMRSEGNPCTYYMRTGQCKFGPACKFHHPEPAFPGLVFPVFGTTHLGSTESSNLHIRTFPALPIPAAAYVYDPQTQTQQPYMPLAVSPSQGFLPQQGWSTYQRNMSPVSSTNTRGSSPSYNSSSRCLGASGSNGQVHYLSFFTPPYPERPDQPECRYFMNSGTCKYGPDCKYNHPRERIAQMLPQPVNPLGLPFRPGQPLCSSYSTYGICSNGPTCKFHHQVSGYPLNCGLSPFPLPLPMPVFDEPIFGRRSSTVVISSETSSPSKSPKDLDWMRKPESATERSRHLGTNGLQKSHDEEAGTMRNSSPASSTKKHD